MQCAKRVAAANERQNMKIEPRDPSVAFDFGQAATAWFKTPGGKDYALRLWVWHSAVIFIMFLVTIPFLMPSMAAITEASWIMNSATFSGQTGDPTQLWSAMLQAAPAYTLFFIGLWVASSVGEAALYRKYLTGEEPARIPVRFNVFVFRNMIAQLGFYLVWFAVILLLSLIIGVVGGVFSIISPVLGGIVLVLGMLALFIFILAIYPVRLAPAAALTALNEKIHVTAAKDITKHRFWSLFGVYLVTYIGGYIAYYIVYAVVLVAVSGDGNFLMAISGIGTENPRAAFDAMLVRASTPLGMILSVLGMAALAAAWSGWMLWIAGVSAYAVRWWQSDDPKAVFD